MRRILGKMDKSLLVMTIIFFAFGLIMIQSASSMESYMRYGTSPYYYFFKQFLFLIVGSIAFLFIIFWPTKNYMKMEKLIVLFSFLSLIGLPLYGTIAKGAKSWYDLGFFSVQPSEFIKVLFLVYMGVYYEKNKNSLDNLWILMKPLLYGAVLCGLIISQPDLGTAMVFAGILFLTFYVVPMSRENKKIINKIMISLILIVAALLVTTGGKILKGYQLQRLNFIDPCERYQEDSGYQLCNSFIAFNGGGLTGKGIGGSTQKYLYLPESYTDFIYPIIVEEWGFIAGIIILVCYGFVLYRILRIALRATNLKNSIIAYGVFIYLLLHILVNLMGITGMIPLTGVPLPFLSYGGSYCLALMIALGLVQRVEIETRSTKERELRKRRKQDGKK